MTAKKDGQVEVDKNCWEQRFVHGCGDCKHYGKPNSPDSLGVCSGCLHGKECRFEKKEED